MVSKALTDKKPIHAHLKLGKLLSQKPVSLEFGGDVYELTATGLSTAQIVRIISKTYSQVKKISSKLSDNTDEAVLTVAADAPELVNEIILASYGKESLDKDVVPARDFPLEVVIELLMGAMQSTFGDDFGGLKKSISLVISLMGIVSGAPSETVSEPKSEPQPIMPTQTKFTSL